MKRIILIIFLLLASTMQAQSLLTVLSKPKIVNTTWYSLDLDGSTEYASKTAPSGLDLNSANYLSGDNTTFTTTMGNWVDNGDVSSSIVSNKMQVVATGHTTSDYISLPQTAFSTTFVDGHYYTVQAGVSSLASSSIKIGCGNSLSSAITTTGTEAVKAHTFQYDSTGYGATGNPIKIFPQANDTYTFDNIDISEAYDLSIEGWYYRHTADPEYLFGLESSNHDIRLQLNNNYATLQWGGGTDIITSFTLNDSLWIYYSLDIYRNGTAITTLGGYSATNYQNLINSTFSSLYVGRWGVNGNYNFTGQIGKITFTRTNGLGEVTGTSIYDWSGDASTFLQDKGTLGNHLTGTNITIDDVNSWTENYTEAK